MKNIIDQLQILTLRRPTALGLVAHVLAGLLSERSDQAADGKDKP
jgi:hypothetical protein